MTEQNELLEWTFYKIYDENKNCYLIGSLLSGDGRVIASESHPLNTKDVYLEIISEELNFVAKPVPFLWDEKIKRYITERVSEVPAELVQNNLRANLIVHNSLMAQKSLDDLFK